MRKGKFRASHNSSAHKYRYTGRQRESESDNHLLTHIQLYIIAHCWFHSCPIVSNRLSKHQLVRCRRTYVGHHICHETELCLITNKKIQKSAWYWTGFIIEKRIKSNVFFFVIHLLLLCGQKSIYFCRIM